MSRTRGLIRVPSMMHGARLAQRNTPLPSGMIFSENRFTLS
jgi:hypothetical protein